MKRIEYIFCVRFPKSSTVSHIEKRGCKICGREVPGSTVQITETTVSLQPKNRKLQKRMTLMEKLLLPKPLLFFLYCT